MQPKAETQAMSEYGEPWRYDGANMLDIENSDGDPVVSVGPFGSDTELMRVVACVNAMQGIPNPEAVRELVEACQSAAENGAMCEWVRPFVAALGEVPAVRHDAIRELIEAATELRQKFNHVALTRLYAAVESLSAPSTGAQQK